MSAPSPIIIAALTACTLASCSLTGCAVGPDYQRPRLDLPYQFRNTAPPETGTDSASWWRSFGDAGLSQTVEAALAGNLDLAKAEARVREERAIARAASAQLLPLAAFTGSAAAEHQSLAGSFGKLANGLPGYDRDQQLYDIGAGAMWDIDVSGGLRRERQSATALARASEFERSAVGVAVAADAADAYLQIRGLQARLDVTAAQERRAAQLSALVDRLRAEGVASEREANQAHAALDGVRAGAPPLHAALESQAARLDVLMGKVPGGRRVTDTTGTIPAAPAPESANGPAGLLGRRPDIAAAEARLEATSAGIGVAISDYYPKISLSALLGSESLSASNLLTSQAFQPQAALGLRWRLFDFGRVDAEVAAAKARDAGALADYRETVLRAAGEVETAFSLLIESRAEVAALEQQLVDLTAARARTQEAYEAGAVSLIEVLDADRALLLASDQLAQAKTEAARAAVATWRALGGGWSART
jgi:NodT family efflux transporter outer membrane factor (OMF) lipoprotein